MNIYEHNSSSAAVSLANSEDARRHSRTQDIAVYLFLGALFGIALVKAHIVSWFKIQEMFRFESFDMFGVIGSAVAVAAFSVWLIRRNGWSTYRGTPVHIPAKEWKKGYRYINGGILFGLGWGLLGACPGSIFALLGSGASVMICGLAGALLGTWAYAHLRPFLPH